MRKQSPTEVVVIDYSSLHQNKTIKVEVPRKPAPVRSAPTYVPRKKKHRTPQQRAKQRRENRKRWHQVHEVELNTTKRMLLKALRLMRRQGVELPPELAAVLSQHESARDGRTGGRRRKLHELIVSTP